MATTLTPTEYRLLVEHSPVMVWRAGLDARCDYFNETWLAFTGRTLEEESGDGWAQGVHPEDLERCVAYYLDHFRRRAAFEMEYRLRRHDGVYRWIFDRGVPFDDDSGTFAGFIGSCVDVDERRNAQAAQQQHNREQLALARDFEKWILAIVSHDIRNPLNAISLSAQMLADHDDAYVKQLSTKINRGSDRITHIVGDLLDLSRERHGGGIPVVLAPADLRALCREVVDEIATVATDRKITVEANDAATGQWDAHRLTQALSNLVGNAVKHGAPGTPIDVRVRTDDRHAIAEIHNAGAIPDEVKDQLFRPFAARSDRRRQGGLGLGLFIAQSIARAHRGELSVDSSPDHGTTFRLVLPRV